MCYLEADRLSALEVPPFERRQRHGRQAQRSAERAGRDHLTARNSLLIALALLLCGACSAAACTNAVPPAPPQEGATVPETPSPESLAEAPTNDAAQPDTGATQPQETPTSPCVGGNISPQAAWDLMQEGRSDITMIDIRYDSEYEEEHVPGSIHIGVMDDDFMAQLRELPRDGTYLIICWHGHTSPGTVYNMRNEGFTSVCSVDGGYAAWRAENLPLDS